MPFPLVVVEGPTASGKTALAVALAEMLGGEIVSADSMQIYKELSIGTAKPTAEETRGIPYYMISEVSIREEYSVSRYEKEGSAWVEDILGRGKRVILCGGTGFYIDALLRGVSFPPRDPTGEIRRSLELRAEEEGTEALLLELRKIDPSSAQRLHPRDTKRIIRALEVYLVSGKTISEYFSAQENCSPRYPSVKLGLCPDDRAVLYRRIDQRVDKMMRDGLFAEVESLRSSGLLAGTASQAIGYKELLDVIEGRVSLHEGVELIKKRSRNYAKRQLTWFRRDNSINWILYSEGEGLKAIAAKAERIILSGGSIAASGLTMYG